MGSVRSDDEKVNELLAELFREILSAATVESPASASASDVEDSVEENRLLREVFVQTLSALS